MANAMLAVNFVPNKFGRVRLEQNGYQYMLQLTRITTPSTKTQNHHSQPPSTIRVKAEAVLNIMRERCMKETTPIPTIYEEERVKLRSLEYMVVNPDHDDVIAELPTYYEKRMSLYRARSKETPLLPITRIDVNLEGKWTQTSAGELFLFADDSNAEKILIFTTTRNFTSLVAADVIYGDGTFYTSPTHAMMRYNQISAMMKYDKIVAMMKNNQIVAMMKYGQIIATMKYDQIVAVMKYDSIIDMMKYDQMSAMMKYDQISATMKYD
ncbi:unnamed protein product [Mytilus coruscus]|uniref:Uncharacterized protein n=1 Tax=Mytilus coruscus TaxID=42192 RepID=A0A6J8AD76_MYTCO|nr:unnamed protein product [Mytilus coruscus]